MSLYIFEGRNIYFTCVFIYSTLHANYSLYSIIINRNILFNAIVTCMNKYFILLYYYYSLPVHRLLADQHTSSSEFLALSCN